ncbi:MAG: HAMP domain-containing histidine kinase [Novosphingobium sp.]|nr:HAMP domain-containing histidine kinase [Novosphingobium sp.]
MQHDDRLATVLRLAPRGPAALRTQFRQLADLLGTIGEEATGARVEAAYERLSAISRQIPATERAAILAEPWLRLRAPRLIAHFAADEPPVALAAIRAAQLDQQTWLDLIPRLPVPARGFLRHRRDLGRRVEALLARLGVRDRGLPAAEPLELVVEAPAEPAPTAEGEGIAALVRRIEAFRRARQANEAPPREPSEAPRLPLGEEPLRPPQRLRAFDFATDPEGRIVWADPAVAPLAVGLLLGGEASRGEPDDAARLLTALRRRQPLRALRLELDGAPPIEGAWQIDAAPTFDPLGGRFLGYRGRCRRPAAPLVGVPRDSEAERMRQVLHELRTPVNAIQGFAEVIQQQLFGPTPHEYRALAAGIAADAARMLAGFEELDRLARLDSGALELEGGLCDFAAVVRATVAQLAHHGEPRGSGFEPRIEDGEMPIALAPLEAERLAWRLLAALAGSSAPGERLALRLRRGEAGELRLRIALPERLVALSDEELMHAAAGDGSVALSAGMFGLGFALRLATAEARAAGGSLTRRGSRLRLVLPGLTAAPEGHSDDPFDGKDRRAAS